MVTVEEQIKQLAADVKSIGIEQVKSTQHLKELVTWKDSTARTATDLQNSIGDLTSHIKTLGATFFKAPSPVPPREEEGRATSHGKSILHQGDNSGASAAGSTLVTGENLKLKTPSIQHFHDYHSRKLGTGEVYNLEYQEDVDRKTYNQSSHPRDFKIPKLDFPKFNGEHPRVWKERCEKYFSMYNLPVHLWVPFATLNFENNASLWLQTYEAQHTIESWPELCVAVDQKFGRDLYQNYMRDILSIKQTSDVLEYAGRFEQAKHRVLVHNRNIDDVFFVQKIS
jgi:hypothetical protein